MNTLQRRVLKAKGGIHVKRRFHQAGGKYRLFGSRIDGTNLFCLLPYQNSLAFR